jgi:S1-C subfamily serine protease
MAEEQAQGGLGAFSDQLADVVERASRSVVTVAARPRQSATGILWKVGEQTVILTADHVVEREDDISIVLPDGREAKATLIGRDPSTDITALRLSGTELGASGTPAEVAEAARVGSLVIAIGRPRGAGPRVSFGAVSTVDGPRRLWHGGEIEGVIYPDVTLYPGFSGGPLVNLSGQVVGMNSSRLTRQNSSSIPVATLRRVAETLVTHGRVRRGYLGIGTQQVPLQAALAQKANITRDTALMVVTVESGSPAEQGGLFIGDIILAVADQSVGDAEALRAQLGADKVGQQVSVRVLRGGEPQSVTVTIGERQ